MESKDQQTLLLAVYKENCDHARHHEVQRERVTAIVGQTAGVIIGLFGFSKFSASDIHSVHLIVPVFLILLGAWGFAAAWKHNKRSSLHRERVRQCRKELARLSGIDLTELNARAEANHGNKFGHNVKYEARTHIIWKAFNILVGLLGLALLIYMLLVLG